MFGEYVERNETTEGECWNYENGLESFSEHKKRKVVCSRQRRAGHIHRMGERKLTNGTENS